MTATVTPIHARRAGHAVSEGTRSARALLGERPSLTAEPLLLHRIDASQLTDAPVHVELGAVEQRQCRPGMCQGLHTCSDHACQGHPGTTKAVRPADEPSPPERAPGASTSFIGWVVVLLVFCLLAAAVAVMGPPQDH